MTPENHAESVQSVTGTRPSIEDSDSPSGEVSAERAATVIVRGEAVSDQRASPASEKKSAPAEMAKPADMHKASQDKKPLSEVKVRMRDRLPELDDDADVGVEKEQIVTRDGKADLAFTGKLLASAAQSSVDGNSWKEYRIYDTTGGKHVFSKRERSVFANETDRSESEVFDPSPSSVPSQLMRSARELTRSRPVAWTDAAVDFFGYDALAKVLYRKFGDQFNEHVS